MKLKLLLVGAVALLSVSTAVAAPPPGKGKPETPPGQGKPETPGVTGKGKPLTTGVGCKPQVTVVLRGTFVSASTTSLSMSVLGANHWGRVWKTAGTASVTLDDKTKVRGNGMKSVADLSKLTAGDRVLVQARSCKADLADSAMPTLTAVRVVGHAAKS
jgi:hypothetical protein